VVSLLATAYGALAVTTEAVASNDATPPVIAGKKKPFRFGKGF
jgi:hypothetical protein